MNTLTRLLLMAIAVFSAVICSAQETMPIIAYIGVPNNKSTEQNFKDFANCGFNVSLYGYSSLQELITACDIAQRYGIQILGHCPETHETPEKAAAALKDNKGFFGYVLQDEPSAVEIAARQKEISRLKSIDDSHCFYINLHPYYADWTLKHTKTKTYQDYLNAATATSCRQLSFDYYPITKDGLREGWYNNLEMIRRQSIKAGIPFWGFVLSVPHADYPQPTMESLRLQVYSNLAYGAQAIQYFTYWTPLPEKVNDYHNGPIDNNGNKTETYYLVQKMNKELKTVAQLFYNAKIKSVHHLGEIPEGTSRQETTPANIRQLKTIGRKGAIISQFIKDGHQYLAIVNKDHERTMKLHIRASSNMVCRINKQLQEKKMRTMLLFKIK